MIASRRRMTEKGSDLDRSGCTMIERIRLVSTVSLYRLLMIDPGPRRGSDLVWPREHEIETHKINMTD